MIENPMLTGIKQIKKKFSLLEFKLSSFFPSIILAVVFVVIIIVFAILWPYGWLAVLVDTLRDLMSDSIDSIKGTNTVVEAMPSGFTLIIYFIVWIPFALLCLPIAIFGIIGKAVVGMKKLDIK